MAMTMRVTSSNTYRFARRCFGHYYRQIRKRRFRSILRLWPSWVFLMMLMCLVAALFAAYSLWPRDLKKKARRKEYNMETVDAFVLSVISHQVSFFMYKTTLLGSWRHHGFVPRDDHRVSFAVPAEVKPMLFEALSRLSPAYVLVMGEGDSERVSTLWQFRAAPKASWFSFGRTKNPKPEPYVSINFVEVNRTHVRDSNGFFEEAGFVYHRELVFPLITRPFEGRQLPSPRDAQSALSNTYNVDLCELGPCKDLQQVWEESPCEPIPCMKVTGYFPFVRRLAGKDGACEELVFLNWVLLDKVVMHHPTYGC